MSVKRVTEELVSTYERLEAEASKLTNERNQLSTKLDLLGDAMQALQRVIILRQREIGEDDWSMNAPPEETDKDFPSIDELKTVLDANENLAVRYPNWIARFEKVK